VSSRQAEKERRRAEREALERATVQAHARRRLVAVTLAALFGVGIVVAGIVLATSGGDDPASTRSADGATVPPPPVRERDLSAAAKAAGCTVREHANEGSEHVEGPVNDYRTNPPTSGAHNQVPAEDGFYDPGGSPAKENAVHSLEHGRVLFQYKPGTDARRRAQLEAVANEDVKGQGGYHTLLLENNTEMDAEVAATAWTRSLTCARFTDRSFDALRAFRESYVDKGPELVP
jgi:hypothetical protein